MSWLVVDCAIGIIYIVYLSTMADQADKCGYTFSENYLDVVI